MFVSSGIFISGNSSFSWIYIEAKNPRILFPPIRLCCCPFFAPPSPSPPAQHRSLRPSCRPPNGLRWGGPPYPFFAFLPSSLSLFALSPPVPPHHPPTWQFSISEGGGGCLGSIRAEGISPTYLFPFGLGEERPQEPQRHKNVSSFWS